MRCISVNSINPEQSDALGPLLSRSLVLFYVEYIKNNIATTPVIPSTPLIPSIPNYSLNYDDEYVEMNELILKINSNNNEYLK